jgi:hypothetical protein
MINFIKNNSKYLTVAGAFALLIICYFQQKENAKFRKQFTAAANVDSLLSVMHTLRQERDSLDSENYPCQIELSRYKLAFEIFSKRNPKAAEQYAEIISNETE